MRISDWSSDVCSSDLNVGDWPTRQELMAHYAAGTGRSMDSFDYYLILAMFKGGCILEYKVAQAAKGILSAETGRSEEHTSELQSLMRISYAVFCLKKQK